MNVLVTGATGFTGSYVVSLLLKQGFSIRCLARPTSDRSCLPEKSIEWFIGDLGDFQSVKRAAMGMDILVNIASIGFGHAPVIVEAVLAGGIKRGVFISTTAIFTSLNASSKAVRLAAEGSIVHSELDYTILRPTMIYGSSRDRNMCRLIRYLRKAPLIPIFGNGNSLQQPVYVGDVAQAVVDCISTEITMNKSYNISGADELTYNQVIKTICKLMGRKVIKIHLPSSPIISILNSIERLGCKPPIKAEQILRLNENKVFAYTEARKEFGYSPMRFEEGIAMELKDMFN